MGGEVLQEAAQVEARWRPWSWWGRFGWTYILVPFVVLQTASIQAYNATTGPTQDVANALACAVLVVGPLALIGRAVARRHTLSGLEQITLGYAVEHRTLFGRLQLSGRELFSIVATQAFLLVFIGLGWQAVGNQLIRHAVGTQRITATVTSTQKNCGKGGCTFDSYGDYTIDGTAVENVQLVDDSGTRQTGTVTVLVNPVHPQRPVWVNDHGQFGLITGSLALVGFLAGNPLAIWLRLRRHPCSDGDRHALD